MYCTTRRDLKIIRHASNYLLLVCIALQLSGCYVLQAAHGQMSLLSHRKPIDQVIASSATTPKLRTRLEYVQAARVFAVNELGLPNNKSYTSYVELKRDYVVWNVFATTEFSVAPKQWCFPVAGCVVYRGYFNEQVAERYALRLRTRGYDATVMGAPAYSTLGHFNDPVLSSMLAWSDAQVAATIFHELAHQVVYVKDDSAFNEAFATVVADAGIKRWLSHAGRVDEIQRWQLQEQRAIEFSALLLHTRKQLQDLYASALPRKQQRVHKQQLLGELKFTYAQLKQHWNDYAGYDHWFDRPLSNADFIAIATYQQCVPSFERLLTEVDDDLPRFYAVVKALARQNKQIRQKVCAAAS